MTGLYCTARLILVTWNKPNLIISLIFFRQKKGPIRKRKFCWMYYKFTVFLLPNYQHVSHTNRIKYLGRVKYYTSHQLLCSSIWLPWHIKLYRNRRGDSMDHLAFLNSIPQTLWLFVFLIQNIIQYGLYMWVQHL